MEMKALETIGRTRDYLDYLEEHIQNVREAFGVVCDRCKDMQFISDDFLFWSLRDSVVAHDLSKLSAEELVEYREVFYPTSDEPKRKLGKAWEHHVANNLHHWDNWTEAPEHYPNEWTVHCAHMVIDWMAMGYKFDDTARSYYEKNKDKINLPENAITFIYEIFDRVYSDVN